MKNVTVTMQDEVARWARVAAAEREMSVSRFVGEVLREKMAEGAAYEEARRRFFALEPRPLRDPGERLPSREELHERGPVLR